MFIEPSSISTNLASFAYIATLPEPTTTLSSLPPPAASLCIVTLPPINVTLPPDNSITSLSFSLIVIPLVPLIST